jgi:hypothetical protein
MEDERNSREKDLLQNVVLEVGGAHDRIAKIDVMQQQGSGRLKACPLTNSGTSHVEATCSTTTCSFS